MNQNELDKLLKEDTIFYSALTSNLSDNISFKLPDRVGKFRITIIGITSNGKYGINTSFLQVQKPFNAILDYPDYIRQNDIIRVNLILQNNTK